MTDEMEVSDGLELTSAPISGYIPRTRQRREAYTISPKQVLALCGFRIVVRGIFVEQFARNNWFRCGLIDDVIKRFLRPALAHRCVRRSVLREMHRATARLYGRQWSQ